MQKLKIFIGFDPKETVAYHTCVQSILEHSSIPVEFFPLKLNLFKKFYKRKKRKVDSTEFSISRFLTPFLSDFKGISLYVDCDFIFMDDVAKLKKYHQRNTNTALWCVKHNYKVKNKFKFLGNKQYQYHRKNWSSLMMFNNSKCKILTPGFIEKANGLFLHRFEWLSTKQIKGLDKSWNVLIGEQALPKKPKAIHFTVGGPYFDNFKKSQHSKIWEKYFKKTIYPIKGKV